MPRTRLAPSPTGALHLGNARTFLINWALARQRGWEIVLRVEDLDGPRVKPEYVDGVIDELSWLGLDWDQGPYDQRRDLEPYQEALRSLGRQAAVYPCRCTRQQIQAAALSAPHGDDHELRYPGTCRPEQPLVIDDPLADSSGDRPAFRVRVPTGEFEFTDGLAGRQRCDLAQSIGDFLVWTKQGLPSYQLAVVVDDHRQGIDWIVRGDDLSSSVPRQQLLYRLLGFDDIVHYIHLPLVLGGDGRRLAKRHGDTRISYYREQGVPVERICGLLARWSGLDCDTTTAAQFARSFDLDDLPRAPVVFTDDDDRWLLSGTGNTPA